MFASMKIKVVNGQFIHIWRYNANDGHTSYQSLLEHVRQTYGFLNSRLFRITFPDDDGTQTTVACQEDFEYAVQVAQKAQRISLKLYIAVSTYSEQSRSYSSEKYLA